MTHLVLYTQKQHLFTSIDSRKYFFILLFKGSSNKHVTKRPLQISADENVIFSDLYFYPEFARDLVKYGNVSLVHSSTERLDY